MKKALKVLGLVCAGVLVGATFVVLAVPSVQSVTVHVRTAWSYDQIAHDIAGTEFASRNPGDFTVFRVEADLRQDAYEYHGRGLTVRHGSSRVVADNTGVIGGDVLLYTAGLSESEIEEYIRGLRVSIRLISHSDWLSVFTQLPRGVRLADATFETITD